MVMPIWDHNPFKWPRPPYVMWSLIVVNFAIFFLQAGSGSAQMEQTDQIAGLIPAAFTSVGIGGGIPTPLTLITYQFLHADFWHVFGNMIFLFVFGDDIEELIGHWRFLVFYLACGVGAGLMFVASAPGAETELIGASGAVAGVISAYLMYRPCAKVTVVLGLIPLRVRAFWVIGGWALWQVAEAATRAQDGIAYWAHVGGFAAGAVLFLLMRPAGTVLFECTQQPPPLPPPLPSQGYGGHLPPPIPPR
ncbi:MAG: rhomboid family intramembrane serine protease [Xanthobacteraceae bacterium]